MADLIQVAQTQLGYRQNANGWNKFAGSTAYWCHYFVSWCGRQCGWQALVPQTGSCQAGRQAFINRGRYRTRGTYTPVRNDIVYFIGWKGIPTETHHVGIVENVSGATVYCIEGNSGGAVRRTSYPLSSRSILGYGMVGAFANPAAGTNPAPTVTTTDPNLSALELAAQRATTAGNSGGTTIVQYVDNSAQEEARRAAEEAAKKAAAQKQEQDALNSLLGKIEAGKTAAIKHTDYTASGPANPDTGQFTVQIVQKDKSFYPAVVGQLQVELIRESTPGKATFKAIYDSGNRIARGDIVKVYVGGEPFFLGFVFTSTYDSDGFVTIVAYDQTRYLKNKDSLTCNKQTATAFIRKICDGYGLQVGSLYDTKRQITLNEENQELFTCIKDALNETSALTGDTYVLYDYWGKIYLKRPQDMALTTSLVYAETGERFEYVISIDEDTYNTIRVVVDGEKQPYVTADKDKAAKWGVLSYDTTALSKANAAQKSKILLNLLGTETRKLTVTGVFGDRNVRAGCMVPVVLSAGETKFSAFYAVEKVTHVFEAGTHRMNLELVGGILNAAAV